MGCDLQLLDVMDFMAKVLMTYAFVSRNDLEHTQIEVGALELHGLN